MKKLLIATAAALVLGAPFALAATTAGNAAMPMKSVKPDIAASSLSERCTALGTQFDKAEATHKSDKNYTEALTLRSEGKALCTAHKEADGIKKIESALAKIGVKPMAKG